MQVTYLGLTFIPLGIMLYVFYPSTIYVLAIFFIPFTTSSLIQTNNLGVPMSLGQFFGAIFILQQASLYITKRRKLIVDSAGSGVGIILMYVFLMTILLSIFVPIVFGDGGRIIIPYYSTASVIFGIVLATFLILKNRSLEDIEKTIKIYVISGIFVSLWGILQFFCNNVLNIEYPWYIFNNSVLEAMHGYKQKVQIGDVFLPRISSVVHEPSMFAKYLLTVLPLIIVKLCRGETILGRSVDWVSWVLILSVLTLSLSTTAYVGIFLSTIISMVFLYLTQSLNWRHIIIFLVLPLLIYCLMYFYIPLAKDVLDTLIFGKSESGSGVDRWDSIIEAIRIFLQFPLFGAGWSMVTSHDLIAKLLSNIGVVGFASFLALVAHVYYKSYSAGKIIKNAQEYKTYKYYSAEIGFLSSFSTLLVLGVLTGIEFYLEYFYFVIAILVAITTIVWHKNNQVIILNTEK